MVYFTSSRVLHIYVPHTLKTVEEVWTEWIQGVSRNKTKRSYTQLDSRKQIIAFWDRVTTIHKGSSTPTQISKIGC